MMDDPGRRFSDISDMQHNVTKELGSISQTQF